MIPVPLHRFLDCDFFTGTDPLFAGLHHYEAGADLRSYRETAHVAWVHHQKKRRPSSERRTTVVLPTRTDAHPWVIVHELGHVLHESLGFRWVADPTTEYSRRDVYEGFAEAFSGWILPGYFRAYNCDPAYDPETTDLFDRLQWISEMPRAGWPTPIRIVRRNPVST